MTHVKEGIMVMDANTTTFTKPKFLSFSKVAIVVAIVLYIGSMITIGFLVYHFTSCTRGEEARPIIIYQKINETRTTTDIPYEEEITTESISTTESIQEKKVDLRLPKALRPHSYNIKLISFIEEGNFTFHGEVNILIDVISTSDNITLHAQELIIDDVSVTEATSNAVLPIKNVVNQTEQELLIIYMDNDLVSNNQYYVSIKFRGILNDLLCGFYRSSYNENNETKWLATTQFQPTDARRAFPCFDEPQYKAKFRISLARTKDMIAISNMPKVDPPQPVDGLPDYVWDHFQESVPMSTYLVAWTISEFSHLSNKTFSVWARPSAVSQTKYAVQVGPQVLQFYESFFGIRYPLPKIDMIAIPDFSAGAMENWGLITYRENYLLYDHKTSSISNKQRVAHVIAHELAHQWFGNLVTPEWWSDLWLNEGFATYVEYLAANYVNPDLRELDQFLINELYGAFMLDALTTSHQISIDVKDPDEISDLFDRISYSKGASLLRMMHQFMSPPIFQKAITNYLTSKMYKNAEQDDLWNSCTEQCHESKVLEKNITVKEIMDTWTLQMGFPVVTAVRESNNSVRIYQERFFIDKRKANNSESFLWYVPITYTTSARNVFSTWLNKVSTITIENVTLHENDWLLLNINQTGYYRVNYDERNWELLTEQLQKFQGHLKFDPTNRAQLINDAMSLASAGYLDYTIALNVTKYLKKEKDYVPWKSGIISFAQLYDIFVRTSQFDKYKSYVLDLINDLYKELGFQDGPNDPPLVIYTRAEVINIACKLGATDCIRKAYEEFLNWKNSPYPDQKNPISQNLREIVYCTALRFGGEDEWNFAWERYLKSNVESEKALLLASLGCSKEVWILNRFLEWSITNNSGIRKHDTARVFAAVATNEVGEALAYRFMKAYWYKLRNYLGTSSTSLSSIVKSCTAKFNTQIEVDDLKYFLKRNINTIGIALRAAEQSIEQAQANVDWMERNYNIITNWLSTAAV